MAFLDAKEFQFGRQNVFAVTVGSADLPTTNASGVIQVGDFVLNLSGAIGAPAYWICTAQSSSSVTWTTAGTLGSASQLRSVAGSATLAATDSYLFITAAGTVTLPAPSAALGTHSYHIKANGGQPVTITPASGNLDGGAFSFTLANQETADVFTDGTNWFSVLKDPPYQINKPALPYTVSVNDRYLIVGAGAISLPAVAGFGIGVPMTVHATASSVTITPSAGTINGATAVTLAANAQTTFITDGTNFFTVGS